MPKGPLIVEHRTTSDLVPVLVQPVEMGVCAIYRNEVHQETLMHLPQR